MKSYNSEEHRNLVDCIVKAKKRFFERLIKEDIPHELKLLWNEWSEVNKDFQEYNHAILNNIPSDIPNKRGITTPFPLTTLGELRRKREDEFFRRLIKEDIPHELKLLWNEWASAREEERTLMIKCLNGRNPSSKTPSNKNL